MTRTNNYKKKNKKQTSSLYSASLSQDSPKYRERAIRSGDIDPKSLDTLDRARSIKAGYHARYQFKVIDTHIYVTVIQIGDKVFTTNTQLLVGIIRKNGTVKIKTIIKAKNGNVSLGDLCNYIGIPLDSMLNQLKNIAKKYYNPDRNPEKIKPNKTLSGRNFKVKL